MKDGISYSQSLSSFSLNVDVNQNILYELSENKFPVVQKYKTILHYSKPQTVTFYENGSEREEVGDTPRPRNMFIIARSILSKLLADYHDGSNKDVSKITSIIWQISKDLKYYYEYLSFVEEKWHQAYYPNYCFRPKVNNEETSNSRKDKTSRNIDPLLMQNERDCLTQDFETFMSNDFLNERLTKKVSTDFRHKKHCNYASLCSSSITSPRNIPKLDTTGSSKMLVDKLVNFKLKLPSNKVKKPPMMQYHNHTVLFRKLWRSFNCHNHNIEDIYIDTDISLKSTCCSPAFENSYR